MFHGIFTEELFSACCHHPTSSFESLREADRQNVIFPAVFMHLCEFWPGSILDPTEFLGFFLVQGGNGVLALFLWQRRKKKNQ